MVTKLYILAKDILNKADLEQFNGQIIETTHKYDADAVFISVDTDLDIRLFKSAKYIVCPSTGIDHIPDPFNQKIFHLDTTTDYLFLRDNIWSTAEHTLGLILSLLRNYRIEFEKTIWARSGIGQTLNGKKIGIVGMGRIGGQMSRITEKLGMWPYAITSKDAKAISFVDIASIHLGLNEETKNYIDENFIRRMKRGSYLINTSRADIVDEEAIVEALQDSHINGYAADVCLVEKEKESPIWNNRHRFNILLTPHIGGYTIEDTKKTSAFVLRKLLEERKTEIISSKP